MFEQQSNESSLRPVVQSDAHSLLSIFSRLERNRLIARVYEFEW